MSTLAHTARVLRLYRSTLKNVESWAASKDIFFEQARKIRAEFKRGARLTDSGTIEAVLKRWEADLAAHKHPDPYRYPTLEGGSKFQRNTPPPTEICGPQ